MRRVLIDSDTGVDDSLAILMLLATPGVEVLGIGSTYGNCRTAQAARSALCTLEVAGADRVPVAEGLPEPPGADALIGMAARAHGSDGLGGAGFSPARLRVSGEGAVDQLLRLSRTRGAEVDLIALGPLTNLAAALGHDAGALARFHSVTVMGGTGPDWVAAETGDSNTRHNPQAAAAVAACRAPITWVGMDATSPVLLAADLLEGGGRRARFARATHRLYSEVVTRRARSPEPVFAAHDSIAAAVAVDPATVLRSVVAATPYLGSAAGGPAIRGRRTGSGDPVHRFVTAVDRDRLERHLRRALASP